MDSTAILIIVFLTLVGLGCGIAIFLANRFLPDEDPLLKRTEEISQYLPGMNCGACGMPGCFAYAGEVAKDVECLDKYPCMTLQNDPEALKGLGQCLGLELSGGEKKVAVVHCAGDSEVLFDYAGIDSCKAASQISAGYKKCPYACLGFGDCAEVCPVNAISIDSEKKVAVVDPEVCIGCGLCAKECPQNIIEIIPAEMPQFLACSYLSRKDIPGREKCSIGCIHCKMCVRASEGGEVDWDDKTFMPLFDHAKLLPAPAAIDKCPKKVILKRDSPRWSQMPKKERVEVEKPAVKKE